MASSSIQTATIASGTSISNAIKLDGRAIAGIQFPGGWDAAGLTFMASFDGVTYVDVYNSANAELAFNTLPGADRYVMLAGTQLLGFPYLKIRSGSSATPVNQTADRVLRVIAKQT